MGGEPDGDADLIARLARSLTAGVRGVAWVTVEEDRALEIAEAAGEQLSWPVHTWSAATGIDGAGTPTPLPRLLTQLLASADEALWVVLDGAETLDGPGRRTLRELSQRASGPAVLFVEAAVSERLTAIPELVVEDLPPPSAAALTRHVQRITAALAQGGYPEAPERLDAAAPALARAALGLPLWAVDRLLADAVLAHGCAAEPLTAHLATAKPALLDRTGLLEVAEPSPEDELGGLDEYKTWLRRRALALTDEAAAAGIEPPRGVLLLGVQGCGKSLAARTAASILGLPLVRLEPGRLFGGTVGESEANLRRVTALVERLAPIVLWLDEVDKGLAGAEGSASDGGTTARVVGSLLTWMQQRQRPVFVAATANRVDALPPELLRRGRLDEIFFVDLPDATQREAILRVHLQTAPQRRLGHVPAMAEDAHVLLATARQAEGFSGAELAAALTEARLAALAESRPLAASDLRTALAQTVPLSATRAEAVDALRRWADGRARKA